MNMSVNLSNLEVIPPSAVPLTELLETYTQCLAMSRDYVENNLKDAPDSGEVDVDQLDQFLKARADLFAVAETSFNALAECFDGGLGYDEVVRRELTGKVVAILEEMTEMENQLAVFLGDRLNKMRETINMMKRSQPVFKHYAQLGTKRIDPIIITRQG